MNILSIENNGGLLVSRGFNTRDYIGTPDKTTYEVSLRPLRILRTFRQHKPFFLIR